MWDHCVELNGVDILLAVIVEKFVDSITQEAVRFGGKNVRITQNVIYLCHVIT